MYRSYSINDMPEPVRYYNKPKPPSKPERPPEPECPPEPDCEPECPCEPDCEPECPCEPECEPVQECEYPQKHRELCPAQACQRQCTRPCPRNGTKSPSKGLLSALQGDDLIIIAVIFILLMDGCEDKMLIAALGLILFSDYFGF